MLLLNVEIRQWKISMSTSLKAQLWKKVEREMSYCYLDEKDKNILMKGNEYTTTKDSSIASSWNIKQNFKYDKFTHEIKSISRLLPVLLYPNQEIPPRTLMIWNHSDQLQKMIIRSCNILISIFTNY